MYCPYCSKETKVLESRLIDNSVRRRRECLDCTNRFTTYEKAEFQLSVKKKDGRDQPFDFNKIKSSLQRACSKANVDIIENASKSIEMKLLAKKKNPLTTKEIGKTVLIELKKIDKLAYLRFASIHKEVRNPKMLEKELSMIVNNKS